MKTAVRWGTAIAAAVLAVSILVIFWSAQTANSTPVLPQETVYRVIGVWEGRVAVFLPDTCEPERVYDTPLIVLPKEEQQRLQHGICVETEARLQERLEDYIG